MKKARLNFWATEEMAETVKKIADLRGWTITETARNLIAKGIEAETNDPLADIRSQIAELRKRLDSLPNDQV